MFYYKRNIGDYHKKAGRLTMLQHGAYCLLLDACYDREQFPTKLEAIDWLWASSKEEIEAVEFVLSKFFTEQEDGRFEQSRIKEGIQEWVAICSTNQINGKKGGRPKNKENKPKKTQSVNLETQSVNLETESKPTRNPNKDKDNYKDKDKDNLKEYCPASPDDTTPKKPKSKIPDKYASDVETVLIHWHKTIHDENPRIQLCDSKRLKILARLKSDCSVDDLISAVDGCASDDWTKTNHSSPGYLFRNREIIEKFLAKSLKKPILTTSKRNETREQHEQRLFDEMNLNSNAGEIYDN